MCDACTDSTGGNGTGVGPFICRNCHYDLVRERKTNLRNLLTVTLYTSTFWFPEVILDGVDSVGWMSENGCVCVSKLFY